MKMVNTLQHFWLKVKQIRLAFIAQTGFMLHNTASANVAV